MYTITPAERAELIEQYLKTEKDFWANVSQGIVFSGTPSANLLLRLKLAHIALEHFEDPFVKSASIVKLLYGAAEVRETQVMSDEWLIEKAQNTRAILNIDGGREPCRWFVSINKALATLYLSRQCPLQAEMVLSYSDFGNLCEKTLVGAEAYVTFLRSVLYRIMISVYYPNITQGIPRLRVLAGEVLETSKRAPVYFIHMGEWTYREITEIFQMCQYIWLWKERVKKSSDPIDIKEISNFQNGAISWNLRDVLKFLEESQNSSPARDLPMPLPPTARAKRAEIEVTAMPPAAQSPKEVVPAPIVSPAPLVTIVTPFYNTGVIFKETLECVLQQTLQDWEWIIVDDCSSNKDAVAFLEECVAQAQADGRRVRIVRHETNRGPSAARNTGLKEAETELVMLLDSDDILEPTCLEKSYWKLATHPELSFVGAWTLNFGAKTLCWTFGFHSGARFLEENSTNPTVMLRKQVVLEVGGFDENRRQGLEAWDFWIRCAAKGFWGDTIHEVLNRYRYRANHSKRWSNWSEKGEMAFVQELPKRFPHLTKATFPKPKHAHHTPYQAVSLEIPDAQTLPKQGKKRLVMMVPHFEIGGADKWNLDVVEYLVKSGRWDITLIATLKNPQNPWLKCFEAFTTDIHIMQNYVPVPDYPRYLRWILQTRNPDVVCITHSQLAYSFLPVLRACFPNIPFVDYVHIEEEYWRNGGYPLDSVRHQSALVLTGATSEHLKKWMLDRGGQKEKIRCIYINVDVAHWRRDGNDAAFWWTRRELGIPKKHAVILYACRLTDQKQPDVFGKTVELMLEKIKNCHVLTGLSTDVTFLIAGRGMAGYEALVKKLEKDYPNNVRYLGAKTSEEIKALLSISDISFLPSKMEGISLALYEAMAMGVVPVGADVGGQAELITPDCGILVKRDMKGKSEAQAKEDEAQRYTTELLTLLANQTRLDKMKIAARERVEKHFRIEQMGAAMETLFDDAIEAMKSGTAKLTPALSLVEAKASAEEIVEQYRLSLMADYLWSIRQVAPPQPVLAPPSAKDAELIKQFRNSSISPKFSKTKRGILRFLMKHL
jgi:glycosyltransferase involved in cell wall biosynthesis